jgi:hypothetical protein
MLTLGPTLNYKRGIFVKWKPETHIIAHWFPYMGCTQANIRLKTKNRWIRVGRFLWILWLNMYGYMMVLPAHLNHHMAPCPMLQPHPETHTTRTGSCIHGFVLGPEFMSRVSTYSPSQAMTSANQTNNAQTSARSNFCHCWK